MSTRSSTEWITGWTVNEPARIDYVSIGRDEGTWKSWSPDLEVRDLGLADASDGKIGCQHIRGTGTDATEGEWHCYDLDFEFFYILTGSLKLENQEGEVTEFGPGSAGYQPGLYWHREISRSGDLACVRITSPAAGARIDGRDTPLPDRAATLPSDRTAVYTHELDENYELGAGPRKFFRYRDLGTRGPSENRIHIHVVRATEPGAGTGWHYHSMAQWFMIVGGGSWIRVEDRPTEHITVGDSMCIGSGEHMRHNVAPFSGDYAVLEMCVPAEYDTIAVGTPEGADKAPDGARE
jgi:mannose-6-phosphate isomerase-like protein (cupin superfamily)